MNNQEKLGKLNDAERESSSSSGTASSREAADAAKAGHLDPWRCQNMGHKRYLMFHCTECSPLR